MRISSITVGIVLTLKGVQGFITHTPTTNSARFGTRVMTSTSPAPTTTTAATAMDGMDPHFSAAFTQVTDKLKASISKPEMEAPLVHFTKEYFTACNHAFKAGNTNVSPELAAKNMMKAMQYAVQYGLKDKFVFGVTHKALKGNPEEEDGNTVDFYSFGTDFFRPVIDMNKSVVLGQEGLDKAMEQIKNGENVVFFANHQSEADPQVMTCLLEKAGYGKEAENVTYVAGHKVTTDMLAIPFSMGRNLICIHSKKHIDADPETKPLKQKQNLAAMNGMLQMKKSGGAMIWVAPSGGRDRRDLETGKVPIAKFDQKTVDMFRLMGNKSKVPTHYYSVSMVTYDLCPPPDVVEAGVGEQRNVRYVPVGIKISDELENVGGVETRHLFTDHAFEVCQQGYNELCEALN
jgi:glycerol-3-phosphate O-acyltransferase